MRKYADVNNDLAASAITGNLVPGANLVGGLVGLFQKSPSPEEVEKINDHPGLSWIPGVGANRYVRQRTGLSKKLGGSKGKVWSQGIGSITPSLILTALGAIAGNVVSRSSGVKKYFAQNNPDITDKDIQRIGTNAGAMAGMTIGVATNPVMALIGSIRRTRTAQEQAEYQQSTGSQIANYFVPGKAAYQRARAHKRMLAQDILNRQKRQV